MKALLAEKLGMTQVFVDDTAVPVTVLKAGPCHVVQVKTVKTDGYSAAQLSFGEMKTKLVNRPQAGHFTRAGVAPAPHLVEVKLEPGASVSRGETISVGDIFARGMKADVAGVTKGKGFTGVMKRHNFSGQRASHGVHRVHRAPGSIGACSTPARVFRGMPMAGRMGGEQRTTLGLEVVAVDVDNDLLLLKGAVPGPKGSVLLVRQGAMFGGDVEELLAAERSQREAARAASASEEQQVDAGAEPGGEDADDG